MVIDQCFEVLLAVCPVLLYEVIAYAAVDKGFFDMGKFAYFAKQFYLRAMVRPQDGADLGTGAGDILTDTAFKLFVTLKTVHVRRSPSHIVDDTFEIFVLFEPVYFVDDRILASAPYGTSLMHGDGAEVTLSVTAVVCSDRELNGLQAAYFTLGFVVGVYIAFIPYVIDMVYLLLCHAWLGRILNEPASAVLLAESFGDVGLVVGVEVVEHGDEGIQP
jgi:hypothetical protein